MIDIDNSSGLNSDKNTQVIDLHQEIQPKLGICLIRLQQYERLMKAMVASMAIEGPAEKVQTNHEQQVAHANTKTLGILVGEITGKYLVSVMHEGTEPSENAGNQESPTDGWFKIRHQLALPSERYELIKQRLAELVAMRNALVHHFLERFDLELAADCRAASAYLDACIHQIDGHYFELKNWARAMKQARTLMASFIQTPQFEDAMLNGLWPDGAINLAGSTIVACVRDAERNCAVDGWTLLDSAILFIRSSYPEHVPERYGCKNWRQVLKKSEQFEIRTGMNPLNGRGQTWYRSRAEVAEKQEKSI